LENTAFVFSTAALFACIKWQAWLQRLQGALNCGGMMHGLQPQRPCQYVPFASALRPRIAWPTAHCKQRFGSASAAASSAADAGLAAEQNLLDNLFQDLCKHHGITSSVQLKHSDGGVGLFAAEPIAKGHTILRVPRSMCILIDNEAGSMTIPPGTCASTKKSVRGPMFIRGRCCHVGFMNCAATTATSLTERHQTHVRLSH
jgi:hypothetical protein